MAEESQPRDWFDDLFGTESPDPSSQDKTGTPVLQPALRQLGITDCPVCRHQVAVFLTKTNRPFVNCGYCSARIFYNGRESMRRLKKKLKKAEG